MDSVAKFNTVFLEFVADLVKVFPNDMEFKMYQIALKGVQLAQPRLVSQVFHDSVTVLFYDKIQARDETFFLQHNYNDVAGEIDDGARIINKTLSCWKSLKDDDKEIVWRYMKVLCVLSTKIYTK